MLVQSRIGLIAIRVFLRLRFFRIETSYLFFSHLILIGFATFVWVKIITFNQKEGNTKGKNHPKS